MDKDLASVQEARELLERAHAAYKAFAKVSQEQVDRVVTAMAKAASAAAERLARLAVDETGMGRYEDKILKNKFGSDLVLEYILPLKTVGIIREIPERKVKELAVPMGVVAALVPTTNPTSTAMYKALISVKGRNAIVMSPHPRAVKCTVETARIMHDAAVEAGAPKDLILAMQAPTLEGTNELMRHKTTAIILATGGYPMVRAAYSSGRPAYGVGPGNVPAIVERTADIPKAVRDIINGKCFDQGVLCSAENSLVCDAPVDALVKAELPKNGAVIVRGEDRAKLQKTMQDPRSGGISADIVGLPAETIAKKAGISVPAGTRVLVAECSEVGPKEFFSREKLSPVLAYFVEDGWHKCCERAIELLEYGGLGHSLALHSKDEQVIQAFFEEKPAFRILLNTTASLGAVGYTTGLVPAMTLGPGTWAGSSTSDNIGPLHLINIKRLAGEVREYVAAPAAPVREAAAAKPVPPPQPQLTLEEVGRIVDDFLTTHRATRKSA
ncbi:MAG TPA: aldehyde dehydrogenase family protein [Gemmatimonadales bacterium]|jgi:acetaldehyde dehydrogenase (acetylating)